MSLANIEELICDAVRRIGSIHKEQIVMCYALLCEAILVVLCFVESNDSLHIPLAEYICVGVGVLTRALLLVLAVNGAHEGHKFTRDDPVQVAVLHALMKLVVLHIEGTEIVPVVLDALGQPLQAMQDRAVVIALSF